jgi:hypothetical protein
MIDSALCGVVGEAACGSSELVVEVDAGGEAEQPAADAGAQVVQGACAVLFEAEQVFQCPEDAFDALPDRRQAQGARAFGFVRSAGADDRDPERLGVVGELAAGVPLVGHDRVTATGEARQQVFAGDLAFFAVGADEHRRAWRAVRAAGQVQSEAPKPARVAAAVAVPGSVRELAAPGGVDAAAGLDRCRVDKHDRVVRAGRASGEDTQEPIKGVSECGSALVQTALRRQVREELAELAACCTQEAPVGRLVDDHLCHAERQHLGVREPPLGVLRRVGKEIIRRAEHTYQQQLEVGVHNSALPVDVTVSNADFELFVTDPSSPTATYVAESII